MRILKASSKLHTEQTSSPPLRLDVCLIRLSSSSVVEMYFRSTSYRLRTESVFCTEQEMCRRHLGGRAVGNNKKQYQIINIPISSPEETGFKKARLLKILQVNM